MNRKLLNGLIVAAVAFGGVGTFTSCKDEDYANDLEIGQSDLAAQIKAIRDITDAEFKQNLETWLNNWTGENSDWTYPEMVAAADAMYKIYDDIMNNYPNISADTEKYIGNLYDWMFNNKISKSDWYDLIFKVADRASSIEINATYNPVLGSIKTPVGLTSTVLATYYVENANEFSFPLDADVHLAGNITWPTSITDALGVIASLKPETKEVVNGMFTDAMGEGNMGGAYVTVNPSSVDLSDTEKYTVSVVCATGETILGADELEIVPNEDKLYFGFTRSEGGIYKIMANPSEENANLIKSDLQSDDKIEFWKNVKTALKDKDLSNIAKLGEDLYKDLNNVFEAYALEVAWEENVVDPETGESTGTITNSVKSPLDLAAVAVHPLSYGSPVDEVLGAYSDKKLPTFSPISEYLQRISNKLNIEVTLSTDEVLSYEIEVDETAGKLYIKGSDGKYYGDANGYPFFVGDYNDFDELLIAVLNQINMESASGTNATIESIKSSVEDLNASLGDFKSYVDRIAESNKLHYADKVVEIYNKVAEKFNNVLANPAHYLQVAALYSDGNGDYHHLSTNSLMPVVADTEMGDGIELLISSYTGDIVVPSLYKYVAITAIDGKAATAEQNAAAGLNQVLPGHAMRVAVNVNNKDFIGKTLQITYVSVDYHGVTSAQNYYVYVK